MHKVRTTIGRGFRNRIAILAFLTSTNYTGSCCYGHAGKSGNGIPDKVNAQLVLITLHRKPLRSRLLERANVNASGSTKGQPGIQLNSLLLDSCKPRSGFIVRRQGNHSSTEPFVGNPWTRSVVMQTNRHENERAFGVTQDIFLCDAHEQMWKRIQEEKNASLGPRKSKYRTCFYNMPSLNLEFFGKSRARNIFTGGCFSNFKGFIQKRETVLIHDHRFQQIWFFHGDICKSGPSDIQASLFRSGRARGANQEMPCKHSGDINLQLRSC